MFHLKLWSISQHLLCECFGCGSLKIDYSGFVPTDVMNHHHPTSTEREEQRINVWWDRVYGYFGQPPVGHLPTNTWHMWMHDTQTQGGSDGCIHTWSTILKDFLTKLSAELVIRHQHTFNVHLRSNCDEEEWCSSGFNLHILYCMTYQSFPQFQMQDQSHGHSNGKDDRYSTQRQEAVLAWVLLVCVFEVWQVLVKEIWATRHHLLQRDLFREMMICGSKQGNNM